MKSIPLLYISVLIIGHLAGCASSPSRARVTGHTIQATMASEPTLRFSLDDSRYPLLPDLGFPDPVTDLDKPGVLQRFGRPAERVSPDLWIYWRFYSPEDAAENGGYDTLVIAFARGRVRTMKLVRGEHMRAYLANAWSPHPQPTQQ